jgi:hypothetical protein
VRGSPVAAARRAMTGGGLAIALTIGMVGLAPAAQAGPVCTNGFKGGPPLATCGNRVFPEAAVARTYVQYREDATGFSEYRDGLLFLEQTYPRYVDVFTLSEVYGKNAVSAGQDGIRAGDEGDTGDGQELYVVRLTDKEVPHKDKQRLFFSLSVHGNERGGLEGGLRAIEDLARDATAGDVTISDGFDNYESNTGKDPEFHSYPVRDVLAKEDVYFTSFNPDGWTEGDVAPPGATAPFARTNGRNIDLNRQMPTQGSINTSRDPLFEREMEFGTKYIDSVAAGSPGGLMAYGADVHGELTSRAYVDIMYPAGQFDSVKHRQLMAIAERTKSVIDETLYAGIQNQIEEASGGNEGEGLEETVPGLPTNTIPTMPAHWATVWDTLGYTDTGFIGDYLAADVSVTGMDYEIFLNHTVPDKTWNVYLQENHINASRAIIKTAMAYAITQSEDFNEDNVKIETGGQAGYVHDPVFVTNTDANGPGELPGPQGDGIGQNGLKVVQKPYKATRMKWFEDTSRLMSKPFKALGSADIAGNPKALDALDTLVLADNPLPKDTQGRAVNPTAYYANIKAWVQKGGNLVLTDRALHALGKLGVVEEDAVEDITVYQPYADFEAFDDPMMAGLRKNARQLVEAPVLGYGIGETASPMTAVDPAAFTGAGGKVVGQTEDKVTVGHLELGAGRIQLVGGALPTQTEDLDHRYGLRDYALTYTGLYIMENVLRHDAPGLGAAAPANFTPTRPTAPAPTGPGALPATGGGPELALLGIALFAMTVVARRRRTRARLSV